MAAALCVVGITGCAPGGDGTVESAGEGSDEYLQARSEQWAEFYGVEEPPAVDMVRYVDTVDLDATLRQCLADSGYPTESNGGVNVPAGNEDAYALAQYICAVQYPVPERYTKEWGDAQLRTQYAWTVGFVIPCLEERQHPIAPPPSESVFMDSWASDPYFPFAQISLAVPDEEFNQAWAQLEATCPQQAPGEVLWDGVSVDDWKQINGY